MAIYSKRTTKTPFKTCLTVRLFYPLPLTWGTNLFSLKRAASEHCFQCLSRTRTSLFMSKSVTHDQYDTTNYTSMPRVTLQPPYENKEEDGLASMKTIVFSLEYFKFQKNNDNIKNLLSILKILSAINLSTGESFTVDRVFG